MSKLSQTESGKAWEFGLANKFADVFRCSLNFDAPYEKAQKSYDILPQLEKNRMDCAAGEAAIFILTHDSRLNNVSGISIQPDRTGKEGDVRDLIIFTNNGEVGISAKHRHNALKHSRLSNKIDFGSSWYGVPCSKSYWNIVRPIFSDLSERKDKKQKWNELKDKNNDYYQPILNAFVDEVKTYGNISKMMKYLLGVYDYYKIVKENGIVSFQSFNLYGGNEWGSKLAFPTEIQTFYIDSNRSGCAVMTTDKGWQVSFRIHNAESRIVPSLKFDVQLIGNPNKLSRHEIHYI